MNATRATVLVLCVLFSFALACTTPAKEAHDGAPTASAAGTPGAAPAAPAASSRPSASPPAPSAAWRCTADADCRTWSSYCNEAPCACRVLASSEPDPRCLGPSSVRCFADPCMRKVAQCQNGACVLTAR